MEPTSALQYNEQVEQDLVICRALVEIFSDEWLASSLAFRGGTALYKLYLHSQPRIPRISIWCKCEQNP